VRELFEKLQDRLDALGKREKIFIWLIVVGGLVVGGYYFLIDPKIEELSQNEATVAELSSKLLKQSPARYKKAIEIQKKKIVKLQTKLSTLKERYYAMVGDMKNGVQCYSQEGFTKLLEDLLKSSFEHRIDLNGVLIEDGTKPFFRALKVVKELDVNGSGEFLQIVRFIRSIEDHPMLMEVRDLQMETNGSKPRFSTHIEFYGVGG